MPGKVSIKITNGNQYPKNHEIAKKLDLQNSKLIRAVTNIFTQHLKNATIHIIGPLPNGTSVFTYNGKTIKGRENVKSSC